MSYPCCSSSSEEVLFHRRLHSAVSLPGRIPWRPPTGYFVCHGMLPNYGVRLLLFPLCNQHSSGRFRWLVQSGSRLVADLGFEVRQSGLRVHILNHYRNSILFSRNMACALIHLCIPYFSQFKTGA